MSKCFQTYSDVCIDYTGLSELGLDIKQGESLQSVLNKLVVAVKENKDAISKCGFCSGQSTSHTTCDQDIATTTVIKSGTNRSSFIPTAKPYSIKSVPTENNVSVTYDLTEAIPEGSRVVSNKVTVNGKSRGVPAKVADSKAISGGFSLRPENFPAVLDIETRVQTQEGERVLKSTQPIDSNGSDVRPYLNINTPSGVETNTQADVNKILDEEVVNLQNQVNSLKNISVSGVSGTTPNEIINNMFAEIQSLKLEVEQMKSSN